MFRIPHDKVYRAFPELDRFSDAECERLVKRARAAGSPLEWWLAGSILVVAPAAAVLWALLVLPNAAWLRHVLDHVMHFQTAEQASMAISLGGLAGAPMLAFLVSRDIGYRLFLRKALRDHIAGARCPKCRYSLLGLGVAAGSVRCPECGATTTLAALGLRSAEDLIPPRDAREEAGLR